MAYQDLWNFQGPVSDDQIRAVLSDTSLTDRQKYDLARRHNVVGRTGGLLGMNPMQTSAKAREFEGITDPNQILSGVKGGKYTPQFGAELAYGAGGTPQQRLSFDKGASQYAADELRPWREHPNASIPQFGTAGSWDALLLGNYTPEQAWTNTVDRNRVFRATGNNTGIQEEYGPNDWRASDQRYGPGATIDPRTGLPMYAPGTVPSDIPGMGLLGQPAQAGAQASAPSTGTTNAASGGQGAQSYFDQLMNWQGDPSTIRPEDIRAVINSGKLTTGQIIQLANRFGIPAERVDQALGWQPGTAQSYVLGQGGTATNPYDGQDSSLTADESVADQLSQLILKDSPYLQAAGTAALQAMNARGLLTSSMADSAFADAYIRNALPIAQQDAGQSFARGERLGGQAHDINMSNLEFSQTRALNEQQFQHAKGLLEAEYGQRMQLLQSEWGSRMDLQKLQNSGALDLENLRVNADNWRLSQNTYLAYVNSMMQAGSSMLAETQAINTQEGLTEQQKRTALESVSQTYSTAYDFINRLFSSSAGWDWSFLPWGGNA